MNTMDPNVAGYIHWPKCESFPSVKSDAGFGRLTIIPDSIFFQMETIYRSSSSLPSVAGSLLTISDKLLVSHLRNQIGHCSQRINLLSRQSLTGRVLSPILRSDSAMSLPIVAGFCLLLSPIEEAVLPCNRFPVFVEMGS